MNVYNLSTMARGAGVGAIWIAYKKGAYFANPCFTQIHPTCIPPTGEYQSKLTLMSESLRNDGRCWVPQKTGDSRDPNLIPPEERDYFLERQYPSYGNLAPRDIASRAVKEQCDNGHGVGAGGKGVYLDFSRAIKRLGAAAIEERYGNLFEMYERITGEDAYKAPMRIYPAPHYSMGGLWVDYNLMSNIPGLFVLGEANFSVHGANRLGASALMQGLADGYFILPYTITDYLAGTSPGALPADGPECAESVRSSQDRVSALLGVNGKSTVAHFMRELGSIMWNNAGMTRSAESLGEAILGIRELKKRFWEDVRVPGKGDSINGQLEAAGRASDFLEFAELLCIDGLHREESCGGHFRVEHQTPDGETLRDDEKFCYSAAWEYAGKETGPRLHKEPLVFSQAPLEGRSYR